METLKYHLAENHLTADPDDYMAQIEPGDSYTHQDIVSEMLKRGTSLTKTDINAVFNLFHQVTSDLVAGGHSINLPICNGSPSISGIFTGPDDAFDPARHFVKYNLNPGTLIREAVSKIKTEKNDPVDRSPFIEQYYDTVSQSAGETLSSKGIGELKGSRLSFDANDEEQGIWFVASDGSTFKVVTIALNKPSKLIFMIPELAAGEYTILLKVKYKGSKSVREGHYGKALIVL